MFNQVSLEEPTNSHCNNLGRCVFVTRGLYPFLGTVVTSLRSDLILVVSDLATRTIRRSGIDQLIRFFWVLAWCLAGFRPHGPRTVAAIPRSARHRLSGTTTRQARYGAGGRWRILFVGCLRVCPVLETYVGPSDARYVGLAETTGRSGGDCCAGSVRGSVGPWVKYSHPSLSQTPLLA